MTGIAGLRARYMCCRFGLRIDGDIGPAVAGGAIAGGDRAAGAAMVHECRRKANETGVAGIALGRGWKVIGRLAQRIGAVVAAGAAAANRRGCHGMVEGGSRPGGR